MDNTPICAATFDNYLDAENYKNFLLANDIPAELIGPGPSSGFSLNMGMLSRVSVMVAEKYGPKLAELPPPETAI